MEAIVLQWAVRIASCDFKPGKKQWAGALLSEKCCTTMKESHKFELAHLKKKKKKKKKCPRYPYIYSLPTLW